MIIKRAKTAYFETKTHIYVALCVALAGWFLNMPLTALAYLVVVLAYEIAVQSTATSVITVLMFGTYLFPQTAALLTATYIICIVVAIVVTCVLVVVWRWLNNKRIKWDSVASGLACMAVAAVFGGGIANIGSTFWLAGVGTTVGMLVGHLAIKGVSTAEKVAETATAVALLIVVQAIATLTKSGDFSTNILYKVLNVGWGVGNNVALVLMMLAPLVLYMAIKAKRPAIYVAIFCMIYCVVMFSFSRGCILILTSVAPVMLGYVMYKTPHKLEVCLVLATALICAGAVFIAYYEQIIALLSSVADKGLSDNGRFELWALSIEDLLGGNIFVGRGLLYGSDISSGETVFRWYHCSVLQMVSNFGIIGGLAFAYSLSTRYRQFVGRNAYGVCVLLAMFMAECYGFIDVTYFTPYYLLPLLVLASGQQEQMDIETLTKENGGGIYGNRQKKRNNNQNCGNNNAKSGNCGAI